MSLKRLEFLAVASGKLISFLCLPVVLWSEPWHIRPLHKTLVQPHDPFPQAMLFFDRLKTMQIQTYHSPTLGINASNCLLILLYAVKCWCKQIKEWCPKSWQKKLEWFWSSTSMFTFSGTWEENGASLFALETVFHCLFIWGKI